MSTYLNIMLKRVQCLRGWTRFASKVESMRCSYSTIHFCVCVKRRTMRRRCRFPGSIRSVALTALSWVGCTQSLASNIDLWFNYLHLIDTAACGPMPFGVVWKKNCFGVTQSMVFRTIFCTHRKPVISTQEQSTLVTKYTHHTELAKGPLGPYYNENRTNSITFN